MVWGMRTHIPGCAATALVIAEGNHHSWKHFSAQIYSWIQLTWLLLQHTHHKALWRSVRYTAGYRYSYNAMALVIPHSRTTVVAACVEFMTSLPVGSADQ